MIKASDESADDEDASLPAKAVMALSNSLIRLSIVLAAWDWAIVCCEGAWTGSASLLAAPNSERREHAVEPVLLLDATEHLSDPNAWRELNESGDEWLDARAAANFAPSMSERWLSAPLLPVLAA